MADTIFALSTLYGKSGIAVIRVTGPKAIDVGLKMTALNDFKANFCYTKTIVCPVSLETIDQGIVIFFKAPHSFTGEDTVEFQVHGAIAVIKDLQNSLAEQGLRPAEPGEFSRRAFLNGKFDLTQAEGLSELIESETSLQRKVALSQLQGNNKNLYEGWRREIISILSNLEALVDFPEEDIPQRAILEAQDSVSKIASNIRRHLDDNKRGQILFSGYKVAIIGKPNVGKSTLLNYLAKREVAIVSDIPGTTRDKLEVKIDIDGYPVVFIDTAGLRKTNDKIEEIGINRAYDALQEAELILHLHDDNSSEEPEISLPEGKKVLKILTKQDTPPSVSANKIAISVHKNIGLEELLLEIKRILHSDYSIGHAPIITQERYRFHLSNAANYLEQFEHPKHLDLKGEFVRAAAAEVGRLTGKIDLEEILDELFGKFCIGK